MMKVEIKNPINYPLLDSLSADAQRLYLFLMTQNGKKIDLDAYCSLLHLEMKDLCYAFIELLVRINKNH